MGDIAGRLMVDGGKDGVSPLGMQCTTDASGVPARRLLHLPVTHGATFLIGYTLVRATCMRSWARFHDQ